MSQNNFIVLVYLFQNELLPRHPNGGMASAAADKVTVDVTNLNQLQGRSEFNNTEILHIIVFQN